MHRSWYFLEGYFEKRKKGLCPYCNRPFSGEIIRGFRVYLKPCGCLLYEGTIEPMKVASLVEYRKAKASYRNLRKKNPAYDMPFKIYCLYWSRYMSFIRPRIKRLLEGKRRINDATLESWPER